MRWRERGWTAQKEKNMKRNLKIQPELKFLLDNADKLGNIYVVQFSTSGSRTYKGLR
jgi:hypothetical protein